MRPLFKTLITTTILINNDHHVSENQHESYKQKQNQRKTNEYEIWNERKTAKGGGDDAAVVEVQI